MGASQSSAPDDDDEWLSPDAEKKAVKLLQRSKYGKYTLKDATRLYRLCGELVLTQDVCLRLLTQVVLLKKIETDPVLAEAKGLTLFYEMNPSGAQTVPQDDFVAALCEEARLAKMADKTIGTAVDAGDQASIKKLLKQGVEVDTRDEHGWTGLMRACLNSDYQMAALLLKAGADPNGEVETHPMSHDGSTPLHFACGRGHLELVKMLLRYKASLDKKDRRGLTPPQLAERCGHAPVVNLIIEWRKEH